MPRLVARMTDFLLVLPVLLCGVSRGESPYVSYVFPAGAQRGTQTTVVVGGHYLHEAADWQFQGDGLTASPRIEKSSTTWFEGPLIPIPDSQQKEDYPVDYRGSVRIDAAAAPGIRQWSVRNVQGLTTQRPFVVGILPEIVEREYDGDPVPELIGLPVTVNGRTFPREDVDLWRFEAGEGETITCAVHAARLGSPVDARLTVTGPAGQRIAEDTGAFGLDPFVRFQTPAAGQYTVAIQDAAAGGLQHHVYRLTITNGPWIDHVFPAGGRAGHTVQLELHGANLPHSTARVTLPDTPGIFWWHPDDVPACELGIPLLVTEFPEHTEDPNRPLDQSATGLAAPCVLNGRVDQPGQQDRWMLDVRKGEPLLLQVHASSLGSPLDSVLTVVDAQGKVLASNDDTPGSTDSQLTFTPSEDGPVFVQVTDRLTSRGDLRYVYRLVVSTPDPTPVARTAESVLNLDRGAKQKLRIDIDRGSWNEAIEFQVEGLPEGVTVTGTTAAKNKNRIDLEFTADESAALQVVPLQIVAELAVADGTKRLVVEGPQAAGCNISPPLQLSINLPTPFKFNAVFESKFAARGTVYVRHYTVDRGGFEGPLTVSLADRQVRHLQGVKGPVITVPAGVDEFDYPAELAPWLEVGRTSRTCLMITGELPLDDGSTARLSYASHAQNDQIIVLTAPEIFSVVSERSSVAAVPGSVVSIPLRVGRSPELTRPARIELVVPKHIQGVQAEPAELGPDVEQFEWTLRFEPGNPGPFNMPLTIRATTRDERGYPVTAETVIEVVTPARHDEAPAAVSATDAPSP